ncbi:high frequency lysogenization protein HflD [Salinispirillum marinum]|uniref:High frequency lysogenization protein HflD homolog n=2 Tax=Saccharospirillaceae TaxID=255527 RepID=A0ABV8BDS5_9GAMM
MAQHSIHEQAIALGGVMQAALLVEQVARRGVCPAPDMATAVQAVLNTSPASTIDIFGSEANIREGLKALRVVLSREQPGVHPDIMRYAMSLLHLEGKMRNNDAMLATLGKMIAQSQERLNYFQEPNHDAVIGSLARAYQDTLSKLNFRIQVTGNPTYLNQQRHADQIRMLLLFGVRSARLWRQCGGHRWQLMLSRGKLLRATQDLLTGHSTSQ